MRCYHFCCDAFLKELLRNGTIYADSNLRLKKDEPVSYAKEYIFKIKKLNKGNGMFFTWTKPSYKGDIRYDEKGLYNLIELDVDEAVEIKTHYENWCSLGMDLAQVNGDLKEADILCKELGLKNGLLQSYNAVFDISNEADEIQILLPYIKKEWIVAVTKCKNKFI